VLAQIRATAQKSPSPPAGRGIQGVGFHERR
jgi:hypothetical protein